MKRFLSLVAVLFTACQSNNLNSPPVHASAVIDGKGTVGPVTVLGVAVTPSYSVLGKATATVQFPNKPYLTIDGDYTTTVSESPGAAGQYDPANTLIRVPIPASQFKVAAPAAPAVPAAPLPACTVETAKPVSMVSESGCENGHCLLPEAKLVSDNCSVPAAPKPAANPCAAKPEIRFAAAPTDLFGNDCGKPIYHGCSGVEGGNCPHPYGELGRGHPNTCVNKPGLGETCPRGFAALFQAIADIFSGRML